MLASVHDLLARGGCAGRSSAPEPEEVRRRRHHGLSGLSWPWSTRSGGERWSGHRGSARSGFDEQLADYFAKAPEAKLGILTNGIQWRFFADIVNGM
ncbi:hypothetical protein [Sorangium sp. So ce233]|uniref:hypothetical protein n=1 Tax=Sorangium sp. So ce233 TaxID=3133290 RepID=UPI003F61AFFF